VITVDRVDGFSKAFDGFGAVNGSTLRVDAGAIGAVIGPNGAGKTSLFNLITGHLRPDRGSVRFEDREIAALPAHEICRRGIGRTFQIANVFPKLTVFENAQVSVLAQQRRSLYDLPPAKAVKIKQVPGSLDETLRALEKDHEFLLARDVFTMDAIDTWLSTKRAKDVDYIRLRPHPSEFYLYYDA